MKDRNLKFFNSTLQEFIPSFLRETEEIININTTNSHITKELRAYMQKFDYLLKEIDNSKLNSAFKWLINIRIVSKK